MRRLRNTMNDGANDRNWICRTLEILTKPFKKRLNTLLSRNLQFSRISLAMNTMMYIWYKGKIVFFNIIEKNTFSKKSLKMVWLKQVWPKMEQQNYLRTIFGHALVTYGTRYFHFWSLVCSHWQLLIQ